MDENRLKPLPLFSSLAKRERRRLAQWADEVDLPEGKQLVREGDLAYEFFVIADGTADVRVGDRHVAQLGPGDFFGEMGLLDEHVQRRASVVTTSPMTAVVMTGGAFRQMSREMPEVGERVRAAVQERCRELLAEA
jgi:CRP-like cAMP-binding protein